MVITVMLASMLPTASIVWLYMTEDMSTRLGIVAFLVAIFSLSISFFTGATRPHIFAGTLA
jgi:hypothetical protein